MMEQTPVLIVGAGPAGLSLALSLAQHEIHSVILERDPDIGEDPRGVVLAGDAVRIVNQLGIGLEKMATIGHHLTIINFHKTSFKNKPFFQLDLARDNLEQAVPTNILQIQPRLERALRDRVEESPSCQLRCNSEVLDREEFNDHLVVIYKDSSDGTKKNIKCEYLIGADGKTGVVRKKFLEPTAGIKQETGLFSYTGTWVAANLKVTLPTPETHPKLDFWQMGLTPEDVYDLFWPSGWHFCSPPGKATACGRFGPVEARLWRHEFAEPDWGDSKDATALLWEHLTPMLTRGTDSQGRRFPSGETAFPQDCVNILRCRPFTFAQKVVNRWFYNRTILIGDAAHVFPPFGGQGIACGVRDSHGLAWRLAILLHLNSPSETIIEELLLAWSRERRQGVDDSTRMTMHNGELTNEPETWGFFAFRKLAGALSTLSIMNLDPIGRAQKAEEIRGYKPTKGGFFLEEFNGGGKISQIYMKSQNEVVLSDQLLKHGQTVLTIVIVDPEAKELVDVKRILQAMKLPPSILSENSLISIFSTGSSKLAGSYSPCTSAEVKAEVVEGYDESAYIRRLRAGTKYAIVRPDFIIFSLAKSLAELRQCLELLKVRLGPQGPRL